MYNIEWSIYGCVKIQMGRMHVHAHVHVHLREVGEVSVLLGLKQSPSINQSNGECDKTESDVSHVLYIYNYTSIAYIHTCNRGHRLS